MDESELRLAAAERAIEALAGMQRPQLIDAARLLLLAQAKGAPPDEARILRGAAKLLLADGPAIDA